MLKVCQKCSKIFPNPKSTQIQNLPTQGWTCWPGLPVDETLQTGKLAWQHWLSLQPQEMEAGTVGRWSWSCSESLGSSWSCSGRRERREGSRGETPLQAGVQPYLKFRMGKLVNVELPLYQFNEGFSFNIRKIVCQMHFQIFHISVETSCILIGPQ